MATVQIARKIVAQQWMNNWVRIDSQCERKGLELIKSDTEGADERPHISYARVTSDVVGYEVELVLRPLSVSLKEPRDQVILRRKRRQSSITGF